MYNYSASFVFTFLFIVFQGAFAKPALLSGPIAMHTTDTTMRLWALVENTHRVDAILRTKDRDNLLFQQTFTLVIDSQYAVSPTPVALFFKDLQANTQYTCTIKLDGEVASKKQFNTLHSAGTSNFSFLVGSCSYITDLPAQMGTKRICYRQAAKTPADFMLWIGDNFYYRKKEWESYESMLQRNLKTRLFKPLNRLLSQRPNYAIWDDHDFGPNNADSSFPHRDWSLALFQEFWGNPSEGTSNAKGVFFNFRYQDAEFFMLDGRYHKSPPNSIDGSLLGKEQLAWLCEQLQKSTATFKFIVCGVQFLNEEPSGLHSEGFKEFPAAKKQLLDFLEKQAIKGVIFLSGDRHFSELYQLPRPHSYDLHEATFSGISTFGTNMPTTINSGVLYSEANTRYWANHFGKVDIEGTGQERQCRVQLINKQGELVWERSWKAVELGYAK